MGLVLAVCASTGTYLLYTAVVQGQRGMGRFGLGAKSHGGLDRIRDSLVQAGLYGMRWGELAAATVVVGLVCGLVGLAVFGAPLPAAAVVIAVSFGWPLASCRVRREQLRAACREAWPRLIDEIRILTANLGHSVPQALFEAGSRAPAVMRPAFQAAHREWLLSTDFERTIGVVKDRLADPTADAACETLLVAHEIGGNDLARRLEALVEDRQLDVQVRRDAVARQAGVRFSRRFVLLVPCGMALVGLSIGTGREAYRTSWGQVMVVLGVAVIALCWVWAGRLLRLPSEERVFR
jgi:tight adherence protein B